MAPHNSLSKTLLRVAAGVGLMDWFEMEEARNARCSTPAPIADQLKSLFGLMVASPMPDRLTELADRLEDALQRGELNRACCKRKI